MCQPLTLPALSLALHDQNCHTTNIWLSDMVARLAVNHASDLPDLYLGFMALAATRFEGIELKGLPGPQRWFADEAACVILLEQQLKQQSIIAQATSIQDIFEGLLLRQQVAIIKGLSLLDSDGTLYPLAQMAAKSLQSQLFEAIAINNVYPAKWFADDVLIQLVERVLAQGLDVRKVCHLQQRTSPRLMAVLTRQLVAK